MRRYMVFAFASHYPGGGMEDFVNSYNDLDEAKRTLTEALTETEERSAKDYGHIYDVAKVRIIVRGARDWTPTVFDYVVNVKDV